ncbi:MAG TPA: ATPase [Methanocorpusculum sp.]|nr:ATPase [Methanocorpusculum sp.]HJJ55966.1 ATPase [Methanocorpusculum sp.]
MAIETLTEQAAQNLADGNIAIGAGLSVGLTGIGTGLGELGIGAAAVGATAENRDMFGLALLFTVLPETIVIFGLVISLLLIYT